MKAIGKLLSGILWLVYLTFFLLSLLVLGVSLFTTVVFRKYEQNDLFDFVQDNTLLLLLGMALVLLCFFVLHLRMDAKAGAGSLLIPKEKERKPPFPWPMLLFAGCFSLFLVFSVLGDATNDAAQLDEIMIAFSSGDYSALNTGGYLFVYPFQTFYVYIGEWIAHFAGHSRYLIYQLLNVILILVNLYFLYKITWELFEDKSVCRIMQMLSVLAFFYYVYATFIYSDVWSFAPQTAALYLEILYIKRGKIRYEAGAGVLIALSYLLKTNAVIALIAMVLVLLLDALLKEADKGAQKKAAGDPNRTGKGEGIRRILSALLLSFLLVFITLLASHLVEVYTVYRTGIEEMPEGTPPITYIAMGMQTTEGKSGWYNGWNVQLYRDGGYDREETTKLAVASIRESIGEFQNSGRYFVNFYFQKFISQWADPTCVSMREMEETARHVENPSALSDWLIFGTGCDILQWVMNVYHSLIYFGVTIYAGWMLFRKRRRRGSENEEQIDVGKDDRGRRFTAPQALLVVFIFGGMLFHELWEASGRYVMRYYLTMLPLAAFGIRILFRVVGEKRARRPGSGR